MPVSSALLRMRGISKRFGAGAERQLLLQVGVALERTGREELARLRLDRIGSLTVAMPQRLCLGPRRLGRDKRRRARSERRRAVQATKAPPRWKQALGAGSARTTFVVGALLTLPGASYLAGLDLLAKQNLSTTGTVLTVIAFNLVMLVLLELPLLGYAIRPEATARTVERFSAWLSRDGGRIALIGAVVVGVALMARGTAGLLS